MNYFIVEYRDPSTPAAKPRRAVVLAETEKKARIRARKLVEDRFGVLSEHSGSFVLSVEQAEAVNGY